ncbi:MAG: hypothetical protein Q4E10_01865 [Porphyromonas sp.]|nr:hypothetical protein [Porphyromonas sp.]
MMKRMTSSIIVAVLLAMVVVGLTACGGSDPKKVAQEAAEAEIKGDYETLYSMLSQEDRDAVTYENFVKFYRMPVNLEDAINFLPEVRESIKVEKFNASVNGETATATFFVHLPDLENIGNLSLADAEKLLAMKGTRLKDLPLDLQEKISESVKNNGVPTKSVAKEMSLKREGDEWKVYLNLAKQIDDKNVKTIFHQD